jgi:hypothetical protein
LFLLGASLSLSSLLVADLSPLIDLLLPLLFDSLDFLEEASPKRISRKSLSFSKRDKSLWAGDCIGSNLLRDSPFRSHWFVDTGGGGGIALLVLGH